MYRNIWCSTCLCFIFHGRQGDISSFIPAEIIVSERAIVGVFGGFVFFFFVCVCVCLYHHFFPSSVERACTQTNTTVVWGEEGLLQANFFPLFYVVLKADGISFLAWGTGTWSRKFQNIVTEYRQMIASTLIFWSMTIWENLSVQNRILACVYNTLYLLQAGNSILEVQLFILIFVSRVRLWSQSDGSIDWIILIKETYSLFQMQSIFAD